MLPSLKRRLIRQHKEYSKKKLMSEVLNVINIFSRTDRWEHFVKQAEEQGIEYKRWEGIIHRHRRKKGVCMAHQQIIRDAKERCEKVCHIAEDDILWLAPDGWKYYLSQIPQDFDVFMSMFFVGERDSDNRITGICSGFTLYSISERFYDVFLSIDPNSHIDREVTKKHNDYKMYVAEKAPCTQMNGYSDNVLKKCDFSPYLEKMNLYKGE